MVEYRYIIKDPVGLHMRPAKQFAELAKQLDSKIEIAYRNQRVSATSILRMVSLGATYGNLLTIFVSGDNEKQSLTKIKDFLNQNL